MDIKTTIDNLKFLKEKYRERSVSLLVGAGFSKNACSSFPSWGELLFDMADELLSDELRQSYDQFRICNPLARESFNAFKKRTIPSVIAKKGYLTMVSEYIKRKGFREAIEYYIEERIPYIDEASKTFKYVGKNAGVSTPIIKDSFAAHQKVFDGEWEQIYTTNYDQLLEYAFKIDGREGYETLVIKNAHELSIGRGPTTIIKLHGDLRQPGDNRNFEFDANPHQQYIISLEDYQEYPKQHEAFTQLMRISLLQGVFCLVGFSGDDPNFQAWLSWVRDILVRGDNNNRIKIFLIDKSSDLASSDKQMFYENHNICYIPLEHPEIKKHIGAKSTVFRDLLVDFFDYLYREDDGPKELPDLSYSGLWIGLDRDLTGAPLEEQQMEYEKRIAAIIKEKPHNRIVRSTYYHQEFLMTVAQSANLSPSEAVVALFAFRETGLPTDSYGNLVEIISKSIPEEYRSAFNEYVELSNLLSSNSLVSLPCVASVYVRLLHSLFALDFENAHSILNAWNPDDAAILKKAFYLSLFDVEMPKQLLSNFISSSFDAKERFYATRLLNIIENNLVPLHPISFFKSKGVTDYRDVGDSLFRDLIQKKDEIQPHGVGKNVKHIYMDGGPRDVDYPKAMAILNYLIEAPSGLSYKNFFVLRNSAEWYKVHVQIFERHPFAALYYSLQCTDKKVKTRIGQDYAYSDSLTKTCLPEILENLLNAYLSEGTPTFLKETIILFAKEIVIAVDPLKWEMRFLRIWKEIVLTNVSRLGDYGLSELRSFVFQALDCMQSKELRQVIISDILEQFKDEENLAINSLYFLRHEGLSGDDERLTRAINEYISSISQPWHVAVIGNLMPLLTNEQKEAVKQKINEMLGAKEFDVVAFGSSFHFLSYEDDALKEKLVDAICKSRFLWNSGVHSDGRFVSSEAVFLPITSYNLMRFSDSSVEIIYKRLKESLAVISYSKVFDSPFHYVLSLPDLLLEMLTFLNQHEKQLKVQSDYVGVLSEVRSIYEKALDYHSVEDGLLSQYDEELDYALDFLYKNRRVLQRPRFLQLVNIVLNRLLLMNSDGLDRCLRIIRYLLKDGIISSGDKDQLDVLVMILNRVTPKTLNSCDLNLAHATNNLSAIAAMMSQMGIDSPGITYWKEFTNNKRFYTNFI